jgi:hypothetical protein
MQGTEWFPGVIEVDVSKYAQMRDRGCRVYQHASRVSVNNTPCDNGRTIYRELWEFEWINELHDDANSRVKFSLPPIWVGALKKMSEAYDIAAGRRYGPPTHCSDPPFAFGPDVTLEPYCARRYRLTMKTPCGSSVSIIFDIRVMMVALKTLAVKIVELGAGAYYTDTEE